MSCWQVSQLQLCIFQPRALQFCFGKINTQSLENNYERRQLPTKKKKKKLNQFEWCSLTVVRKRNKVRQRYENLLVVGSLQPNWRKICDTIILMNFCRCSRYRHTRLPLTSCYYTSLPPSVGRRRHQSRHNSWNTLFVKRFCLIGFVQKDGPADRPLSELTEGKRKWGRSVDQNIERLPLCGLTTRWRIDRWVDGCGHPPARNELNQLAKKTPETGGYRDWSHVWLRQTFICRTFKLFSHRIRRLSRISHCRRTNNHTIGRLVILTTKLFSQFRHSSNSQFPHQQVIELSGETWISEAS